MRSLSVILALVSAAVAVSAAPQGAKFGEEGEYDGKLEADPNWRQNWEQARKQWSQGLQAVASANSNSIAGTQDVRWACGKIAGAVCPPDDGKLGYHAAPQYHHQPAAHHHGGGGHQSFANFDFPQQHGVQNIPHGNHGSSYSTTYHGYIAGAGADGGHGHQGQHDDGQYHAHHHQGAAPAPVHHQQQHHGGAGHHQQNYNHVNYEAPSKWRNAPAAPETLWACKLNPSACSHLHGKHSG